MCIVRVRRIPRTCRRDIWLKRTACHRWPGGARPRREGSDRLVPGTDPMLVKMENGDVGDDLGGALTLAIVGERDHTAQVAAQVALPHCARPPRKKGERSLGASKKEKRKRARAERGHSNICSLIPAFHHAMSDRKRARLDVG